MAKIREEEIVDRWSVLIEEANGQGKEVFKLTEANLKDLDVPNIELVQKEISPSLMKRLKGKRRTFLVVKNSYLEGYLMYIGAADYGKQLSVSWYLTLESTGLGRLLAKLPWWLQILFFPLLILLAVYNIFRGKKSVSPANMDLFDLEELTAYVTTVHHALIDATKEVSQTVGFDFTKVDQKSKGFLNIS
jgi:hypothetical protein